MTETNDTNNENNISESELKPESRRPVLRTSVGCKECNGPTKKFQTWCKSCIEKHFQDNFNKWTSGNEILDEFIRTVQMEEFRFSFTIEWIPFDRFSNIEFIKEGGFGTISKAIWLDGYIHEWDLKQNEWKRAGRKNVCLKRIADSKDKISMEFLDEIKKQVKAISSRVITIYGFTQDPESKDYMIVMQYSFEGSLREFLNKNYTSLTLYDKICILKDISCALKDLQKESRLHQNLHPGNIIMIEKMDVATPSLSDLGIYKPIRFYKSSSPSDNIPVYGVLPYVAPELLFDSKHSQESDIYSFGIIMHEVLTGIPPYYNVSHDGSLASKIVEGQRPEVKDNQLPPLLLDRMKECWDKDPDNRPMAQEMFSCLYGMEKNYNEKDSEIYKQIKDKDILDIDSSSPPPEDEINPLAIYTSRILDFNDLPRTINQDCEKSSTEDIKEKNEKELGKSTRCCNACVIC
ncbi:hypothetical protein Glove_251g50 [Diversispora epigaea]|uniref:Protein kinase domain-containing protein n=1 Tax=Diversispora epigaea TaxID=1348612 RepID=A0A397I8E1_9GLOM|nr:hypothetical protein Glove_251g50 [Diversispora epigaea]